MKQLLEEINANIVLFATNAAAQVGKGNNAAGRRARTISLTLEKQLKEFRKISVEESKKKKD